jgi:hypothetical protein
LAHYFAPRILAIDLGSTFTRAILYSPDAIERERWLPIVREDGNSLAQGTYGVLEFPTEGAPILDPKQDALMAAQRYSLKYVLYVLAFHEVGYDRSVNTRERWQQEAQTVEGFFEAYRLIQPVRDAATKEEIRLRLRRMLVDHLRNVKRRVDHQARKAGRESCGKIALAVPVNWGKGMQDYYARIVLDVWTRVHPDHVSFVSESESMIHYAKHELKELRGVKDVVTVDLGGHSMSLTAHTIVPRVDATIAHASAAAFGGSELWEHEIRQDITKDLDARNIADKREFVMGKLMRSFREQKRELKPGVYGTTLGANEAGVTVDITRHALWQSFDAAFDHVLDEIRKGLTDLDPNSLILVSGGSTGCTALKNRVQNIAAILGFKNVIYLIDRLEQQPP